MVGKRGVLCKRPAVLCTAAFVMGIVSAKYSGWVTAGSALGVFLTAAWFLRGIRKGGRRVSAADRLLFAVPVFLLFGSGVMRTELHRYERKVSAFASCMEAGREVLAEGTVSHIGQTNTGVRLELTEASAAPYDGETTGYCPVGTLVVYAEDGVAENGEIKCGQRIFVYGSGSIWEEASNPGGFDARTYYFSMGITGAVHGKTIRIRSFSYHRLNQTLFQAKNKLLQSYVTYLGEENAGVIASMLLGERALLSEETEELYRHGGISHILAISGLHVSLIGSALYELLRKTFLGRNGAIPVACGGVLLYGSFVEAGISTKRAVLMFLLLLLATALGRTYDTLSAMSVSAIVILWGSPGALYTASFQLSYAAAYGASVLAVLLQARGEAEATVMSRRSSGVPTVGGTSPGRSSGVPTGVGTTPGRSSGVLTGVGTTEDIGAAIRVAGRSNNRWIRVREYIVEKMKNMFLFGLAIQVVTFPFTVYHFFEYPIYGFFINPVVVPLMTILLLCGLMSGVCGLLVPWLGYFFAGGAGGILWIYEILCRWVEKLPGSLLVIGKPGVWQMAVYYVLLAVGLYVWMGRGSVKIIREKGSRLEHPKVFFTILLFLPLCLLPVPRLPIEISFLAVGQGDGIVLREQGGAVLLVDGGSTSMRKVGEKCMVPYLKSQGIRVIDCAFVSHTDSDHMSGVKELLAAMPVYSEYRESVWGYTGTPVIKRLVLPEWYGVKGKVAGDVVAAVTEGDGGEVSEGVVVTVMEGGGSVSGDAAERMEGSAEVVISMLPGEVDEAYSELLKLAEEKQVEVCYMAAGDRMRVGEELVLSCLAPEDGTLYANKNAASMVLLASYGAFDLLLTGDMEAEGERRLLEGGVIAGRAVTGEGNSGVEGCIGKECEETFVEVLKVSHHGSRTASSEEFISALRPQIAVISCGKGNRYGHPHTETVETLTGADSRVYRTDEHGCVRVKVRKDGRISVQTWCEPDEGGG